MSEGPPLGRFDSPASGASGASGAEGAAGSAGPVPDLHGLRVLVVEDEPDSRLVLAKALQAYRADVTTAGSAAEAEVALALSQHDVIVSDIGLPGRDGYEFLRALRSRGPGGGGRIPAVALTGYAGVEEQQKAREAGFQSHLAKPVVLTELAAVIGELGRKARRGE